MLLAFRALCALVTLCSVFSAGLGVIAGFRLCRRSDTFLTKLGKITATAAAGAAAPWIVFGVAAIAVLGTLQALRLVLS